MKTTKLSLNKILAEDRHALETIQAMNKSTPRLSAAIESVFNAARIKGFVQSMIQVRGEMQQLETQLEQRLDSKAKANQLMKEIKQIAISSPLSFTELGDAANKFLMYGITHEDVVTKLRMLSHIAVGASTPLTRLADLYWSVSAGCKIDISLITLMGIPILDELPKVFDPSQNESVTEQISLSQLDRVFLNMTSEGGIYSNAMGKQSETMQDQINSLKEAWATVYFEMDQYSSMDRADETTTRLLESYEDAGKILKGLIDVYGAYKTAVIVNDQAQFVAQLQTIWSDEESNVQEILSKTMLVNIHILLTTAAIALVTMSD